MNYSIFPFALTSILLQAFWPAHSQLPSESPMGFHSSPAAAALCTVHQTVVAVNEIISFVTYWERLGGKGDWVNLRYWSCYYFVFLEMSDHKTVVFHLFSCKPLPKVYIIYTLTQLLILKPKFHIIVLTLPKFHIL